MAARLEKYQSGKLLKGDQYQFFLPTHINENWSCDSPQINQLVEKTAVRLGELNSYARLVPDIELFIRLHVAKEAVVSSRIEGTKTHIDEALLPEEEVEPERRNDWKEVVNYIQAMNKAISMLKKLPLSSRLLKEAHAILLSNVRGEHRCPGLFRTSQNWIGGSSLMDAVFVPPEHQYVPELMGDLEKFLHNTDILLPDLIRIAIAHYQFETIHPFLDGNGRIGRLLITLFLVSRGILDQPLLYPSTYFEKNRVLYYENLMRVRTHNDMLQWLRYFLVGMEQTATEAVETLTRIMTLKKDIEQRIHSEFGRRGTRAVLLLQELFKQPIVSVDQVATLCDVSYGSANKLITRMGEHRILMEITGQSRNRLFAFKPYLEIFDPR